MCRTLIITSQGRKISNSMVRIQQCYCYVRFHRGELLCHVSKIIAME